MRKEDRYTVLPHYDLELHPLHPRKHIYGIVNDPFTLVKVITDKSRKDSLLEIKLQKEAKNLGLLCPEIYDYFWHDGVMFIVMEKIRGKTIKEKFSYKAKEVPRLIFNKIRDMVDLLYDNGIEYVDITSVNFMVTKDNKVVVIDFGHAYYSDGKTIDYYLDEFLSGKNKWNPEMI